MGFLKKGNGLDSMFKGGGGKTNPILIVVSVVIILGAVFFVARPYIFGGSNSSATATDAGMVPPTPGGPGPAGVPGGPAGAPGAGAPPSPGGPGAAPKGASAGPSPAAPGAPAVAKPAAAKPKPAPKPIEMETMTVFETVTVSYPKKWGLAIGATNSFAAFTDGKARFEVHPPDLKANSARAMADAALKQLAKGGSVTAEGFEKVANQDAYAYQVKVGGQSMRIVAVDAPTRVVLKEYVKGGQISAYNNIFSQMESKLAFR